MLCINNPTNDIYFNLAAEEYLLKYLSETVFMLWSSTPAVVVGKHQDISQEVNMAFAKQCNILIARRLSGGGAVYHDSGNLNFTFITKKDDGDSHRFTSLVIEILSQLEIRAEAGDRNMITINGLKISGSAQCIHKSRMMHHGTLLFDSDLSQLTSVLKNSVYTPDYKWVKSISSPVTNIRKHLLHPMDMDTFRHQLMLLFLKNISASHLYKFTEDDICNINHLRNNKYLSPDWNFKTFSQTHLLYMQNQPLLND